MKKMKKSEKVFRTLLIAAMGVVLSGVSLATAFASYEPTIKVEHVWQDKGNVNDQGAWDPSQEAYPSAGFVEDLDHKIKDDVLAEGADNNIKMDAETSAKELGAQIKENLKTDLVDDVMETVKDQLTSLEKLNSVYSAIEKPSASEIVSKPDEVADPGEEVPAPAEEVPEPAAPGEDASEEELAQYEQDKQAYEDYLTQKQAHDDYVAQKNAYDAYLEATAAYKNFCDYFKDYVAYQNTLQSIKDKMQATLTEQINALDGEDEESNIYLKALLDELKNVDNENIDTFWSTFMDQLTSVKSEEYVPDANDFDKILDEVTAQLGEMNFTENTIKNVADAVARAVETETKNITEKLDVDKLDIVNVQTTDVKEGLLQGALTNLNPLEYTDVEGYDNTLRITVMVVTKDTWSDDGIPYISMDGGHTWQKNGTGEKIETADLEEQFDTNGNIIKSYLYTYIHVKEPTPTPPPSESVPVTPPPSESVPVTPTPSTSVPPSETPIDEPETPLDEPDIPLDEVELPLEEIPLTGDISYLWYAAALISAAGLLFLVYRNKETA